MGIIDKWKQMPQGKRITILLVVIVLQLVLIHWLRSLDDQHKANFNKYLVDQNCKREGFTHGQPFYRCDTGLLVEWEVKEKSNP